MIHEPAIPTKVGKRKPDLVALVDEVAYVVDVTITLDSTDISGPYKEKVCCYARLDVIDWVANVYPGKPWVLGRQF